MASTQATQTASELASQHHAAQASLADALAQQVLAAWNALLDVAQLKKTIPALSAGVAALVHQYGSASAAVAADYYDSARLQAGVSGLYTVIPASPPGPDEVTANVRWATKNLYTPQPDVAPAKVLVQGAAQKLAMNAGRDTITNAVRADRKARGWARHTEPGCCAFCAMLASRGGVYVSEKTASFEAHDHDRCVPEPVFGIYEPPAHARQWQALWRTSTRGYSGDAAIAAFRRAYDSGAGSQTPHVGS